MEKKKARRPCVYLNGVVAQPDAIKHSPDNGVDGRKDDRHRHAQLSGRARLEFSLLYRIGKRTRSARDEQSGLTGRARTGQVQSPSNQDSFSIPVY